MKQILVDLQEVLAEIKEKENSLLNHMREADEELTSKDNFTEYEQLCYKMTENSLTSEDEERYFQLSKEFEELEQKSYNYYTQAEDMASVKAKVNAAIELVEFLLDS